jgi:hypothetical protein
MHAYGPLSPCKALVSVVTNVLCGWSGLVGLDCWGGHTHSHNYLHTHPSTHQPTPPPHLHTHAHAHAYPHTCKYTCTHTTHPQAHTPTCVPIAPPMLPLSSHPIMTYPKYPNTSTHAYTCLVPLPLPHKCLPTPPTHAMHA